MAEHLHLHEEVVDASQAVGSANVLLLVPLVHQGALVLDPKLLALVLTRRQHRLCDLKWGGKQHITADSPA